MDLDKIAWLSGVVVVIISAIIEKASSKFKPWTIIAQAIGKAVNSEVITRLDLVDSRITKLEANDMKQEKIYQEEKAKEARRRIIAFADELRLGIRHSQENFDNVLDDISYYENYCHTHPEFKNEKAVRSIAIVDEMYDKCLRENTFL